MTTRTRHLWPVLLAFGIVFTLLNLTKLALGDGGAPRIVGVGLGIALACIAIAIKRGWKGVRN